MSLLGAGGESAARQKEENPDKRGRWERRQSRLHYDVEREVRERRMFARWAVIGENVNATVATFREFGSRPPSTCFIAASLKEPHYHVFFFNKLIVNFPVLLNPIV